MISIFTKANSLFLHIKKIGFFATLSYLIQRRFVKKNNLIKIKIPRIKDPIFLRNKSYDTHIFYQIFVNEDLSFINEIKLPLGTIVDAGANIGLSTVYLKNKFPNAAIISIEPSLVNFKILKKNIEGYQNISIVNGALMGSRQKVSINNPDTDYASFRVSETNNLDDIQAYPISHFINMTDAKQIDFFKIDIEGSERDVFEKIEDATIKKISAFAIEIHEDIVPGTYQVINERLQDYNQSSKHGEYNFYMMKNHL